MESQTQSTDIFYYPFDMKIWEQRHKLCSDILEKYQVSKVIDLGCASGKLLKRLTYSMQFTHLEGMDLDKEELIKAKETVEEEYYTNSLKFKGQKSLSLKLWHGDVTKNYKLFKNYHAYAVTAIELIEHLPKKSLQLFEENVFGFIKPQLVIISTPNYDFNYWFHNGINKENKVKELNIKEKWLNICNQNIIQQVIQAPRSLI